jgi:Family of unknown function (DUF5906)/Primase C terminal 2 (PriCT-2)
MSDCKLPKPETYNGDIGKLPPALEHLRDQRVWVNWRWFWNGKKWTKPPYRADSPDHYASTNNAETWGSHKQAVEQVHAGRADGIGFALRGRNIGGVDLDHCRDPVTGQIGSWAEEYVRRFPNAYVEATVSGMGLRILGTSELEGFAPKFKLNNGNGAAIELFSNSHHYLTLSCNEITSCSVLPPIGETMTNIATELGAPPKQNGMDFDAAPHVDDAPPTAPDDGAEGPEPEPESSATPWSYTEELRLRSALAAIPTDEKVLAEKFGHAHDVWVKIGRAIERLDWGERGYAIWRDWSAQNAGEFDERGLRTQWASFNRNRNEREKPITIATTYLYAIKCGWRDDTPAADEETSHGIALDDFRAYMPTHSYLFVPTRQMWAASSVNSRIPSQVLVGADGKPLVDEHGKPKLITASAWLDRNLPVEQMTWAPGLSMIIEGRLISEGGWIEHSGVKCFNLYRAPTIVPGDTTMAGPWLDHMQRVFDGEAEHLLDWLAHRVQRPEDKINHAIVIGGAQGIGKDTALEPVKRAVGPWNFCEVSPHHMLGRFNGFLKSVILRISEARDLGDMNRFQFYDHMKAYTAAPPDVLRVDEKHMPEYAIPNCCGVIITTNHKADGIYLPPDDRRHFVAWSPLTKSDFDEAYWNTLWSWYANGGDRHVAAYLAARNISKFNPKAPPLKTPAFWDIVDASRAPEEGELADVLDEMGRPYTVTLGEIRTNATGGFLEWLQDRKNRRTLPHRLEAAGYVPVRNDTADDGLWKLKGKRQVIYAKAELSLRDRIAAVRRRGATSQSSQ